MLNVGKWVWKMKYLGKLFIDSFLKDKKGESVRGVGRNMSNSNV